MALLKTKKGKIFLAVLAGNALVVVIAVTVAFLLPRERTLEPAALFSESGLNYCVITKDGGAQCIYSDLAPSSEALAEIQWRKESASTQDKPTYLFRYFKDGQENFTVSYAKKENGTYAFFTKDGVTACYSSDGSPFRVVDNLYNAATFFTQKNVKYLLRISLMTAGHQFAEGLQPADYYLLSIGASAGGYESVGKMRVEDGKSVWAFDRQTAEKAMKLYFPDRIVSPGFADQTLSVTDEYIMADTAFVRAFPAKIMGETDPSYPAVAPTFSFTQDGAVQVGLQISDTYTKRSFSYALKQREKSADFAFDVTGLQIKEEITIAEHLKTPLTAISVQSNLVQTQKTAVNWSEILSPEDHYVEWTQVCDRWMLALYFASSRPSYDIEKVLVYEAETGRLCGEAQLPHAASDRLYIGNIMVIGPAIAPAEGERWGVIVEDFYLWIEPTGEVIDCYPVTQDSELQNIWGRTVLPGGEAIVGTHSIRYHELWIYEPQTGSARMLCENESTYTMSGRNLICFEKTSALSYKAQIYEAVSMRPLHEFEMQLPKGYEVFDSLRMKYSSEKWVGYERNEGIWMLTAVDSKAGASYSWVVQSSDELNVLGCTSIYVYYTTMNYQNGTTYLWRHAMSPSAREELVLQSVNNTVSSLWLDEEKGQIQVMMTGNDGGQALVTLAT